MNKCSNCKVEDGVISIKDNKGKELFYCSNCAKTELQDNFSNLFPKSGLNFDNIIDMIGNAFPINDFQSNNFSEEQDNKQERNKKFKTVSPKSISKGVLAEHCSDLTQAAKNGELDSVLGREDEINRLINVLNRRTKNNPVLIGEPGVGKTAIAEGLAIKIINNDVPDKLKNKKVLSLDITSLTSGTIYRGMFEERMKKLVREVESRDDIILFIDELHMILGAGSSMDSNIDAANILKPYLSRGKMQIIGATTSNEYRKIEEDSALSRRFQTINIEEPNQENALKILMGLKSYYEKHHNVIYKDEAVEACVKLSDRYISDRFMPDKAIDLMDEVGSKINLSIVSDTSDPRKLRVAELQNLEKEAAKDGKIEEALSIRQEYLILLNELNNETKEAYSITKEDVEKVLEQMTGIPVTKINSDDKEGLINLKETLTSKVVGQEEAIEQIVKAIKRNRISIRKQNKPTSFLFTGPTGVGKTELTKTIAEELFGDKKAIIRFDMSEFMEEHSVSKLIGSPPGYIGHEQAGQLTEQVRRKPYSIILLDEIEKAHSKVLNILLQLFDDGRLTDSHGTTVDFSNTIIVMTSNLGSTQSKQIHLIKSEDNSSYSLAVRNFFSPELLNRIDKVVTFNHLSEEHILKIVDIMLLEVINGLKEKNIEFKIDLEAKKFLSEKGYQKEYGARPLYRTIIDKIDDPITELLLENPELNKIEVTLDKEKNQLTFKQK